MVKLLRLDSSMNELLAHIEAEYRLYKRLGEGALRQMEANDLVADPDNANSAAVIVWHLAGNLESRFMDFLTADGEKPWRHRDAEFESRHVSRPEITEKWDRGWDILFAALADLTEEDLTRTVTIRGVPIRVDAALLRSMAHVAYHVGQIVYLGRRFQGEAWEYLTIPPGQSAAYNESPTLERTGTRKVRGEDAR